MIVLVAFVSGIWPGILAAVLGLVASWYLFIPPLYAFTLTGGAAVALGFYVFVAAVNLLLMNMALNAFIQAEGMAAKNREMTEYQTVLIRELDHRIKNLFAVVSAIVKLSSREVETSAELAERASERIMALSRSHSALWHVGEGAESRFAKVAKQVLEPYLASHGDLIAITGDAEIEDIRHVQIITLILHELATNSAKYGSLHRRAGGITVSAQRQHTDKNDLLVLWREEGVEAPPPKAASGSGFGSEMIARLVAGAGGTFERSFENGTMSVRAVLPVS